MSHAQFTQFAHLKKFDIITFATPLKVVSGTSPSTITVSTFLGASVIVLKSSLLIRVDLSVEIVVPLIWAIFKRICVRG